ncbi:hypothetical protein FZEAL_9692 [Fusarium zealandicum]|uniref:Clr5 domain-containing protein n=1 Tax=Fusarium zealandicum TaxID=1053134 RepID=A0A8H4U916_9HYPO|nr:hypothetical protein FZEAL_9692 [Fusarium zealandicum]
MQAKKKRKEHHQLALGLPCICSRLRRKPPPPPRPPPLRNEAPAQEIHNPLPFYLFSSINPAEKMMAKPWDKYRRTIIKLYINDGRTLEDVRGIMKTQYSFEASIRSYRQHFDLWGIGKYNCKKRQARRQSLNGGILPSPPHSPPVASETASPPPSSCGSQPSPEQRPLSGHAPRISYYDGHVHGAELARDEPRIKTEGHGWEDMDLFRNPHVAHSMLPSCVSLSLSSSLWDSSGLTRTRRNVPYHSYAGPVGWPIHRETPSSILSSPPLEYCRASYQDSIPRYMPEPIAFSRPGEPRPGLHSPGLPGMRTSVVKNEDTGSLIHHHYVGYQGLPSR